MNYIIYKNGVEENHIVADEEFCIQNYSSNGYSYTELTIEHDSIEKSPPPTPEEQLRADVDYIAAMTGVIL